MDFSLPRPFPPGSESSRCGTFAPWNFRSLELSHPGTFAPWNFRTLEHIIIIIIIFYLPKTTIIATSQLYVNKRLPIGLPNIFGFVVTQRRVFLRLIVRLGAYKQARDRSVVSRLITLISGKRSFLSLWYAYKVPVLCSFRPIRVVK